MDYAAATPVDSTVVGAMNPFLSEQFYNPSAVYLAAKQVKAALEESRTKVGQILGAKPGEIVFTAGGTEANNLAISGIMQRFPDGNMLISAVEHESVREVAKRFNSKEIPVDKNGVVDPSAVNDLIDDHTVLVSVMHANNEVGSIQPIKDIAQLVRAIRQERQKKGNKKPLLLHTDACQSGNYLDLHVDKLGADMMTLNGGKIYGPKQSGVLYVRAGVVLQPVIVGGGQEHGLRSGTENVAGAIGFSKALDIAQDQREKEVKRLAQLQQLFISLLKEKVPQATVNGSKKRRLPNNVHITIAGTDNERLMMELDERGVMCATGSACSASKEEPSHVLASMGMSDGDIHASLRFTMGRSTTQADIEQTVKIIASILA